MTQTATLTLTDFLLARVAEDEAVARFAADGHPDQRWEASRPSEHDVNYTVSGPGGWPLGACSEFSVADAGHIARFDPARVLAECEAKRRIVNAAFDVAAQIDSEWGCCHTPEQIRAGTVGGGCYGPGAASLFLLPLAAVYADHPDYRDEWRP